jgi:hypothetical protein
LTDPFDDASLAVLVEGHIGAPRAIYETYIDELVKGREKN